MPPFSSALLPLSLKEIGGLGPTEGDCVSRLPTIMTLRSVTRRQRDILHDVCQICLCISLFFLSLSLYSSLINFCPVLLSQVSVTDEETDKMNLFLFVRLRREVQERIEGVKKTESHRDRDKRVQLYFLFIQALFETVGRNRGCIHLLFYTSADPHSSSLPPALFSFNSLFSPPFVSF